MSVYRTIGPLVFLFFAQNIDCGYRLEPPCQGSSNKYPQAMFWSKNKKNRYAPVLLYYTLHITQTCFPDVKNLLHTCRTQLECSYKFYNKTIEMSVCVTFLS